VNDAEGRALFGELVKAENNHKSNILKAFREMRGADISPTYLDDMSSKGVMEGGVFLKDTLEWLNGNNRSIKDILELSMQLETNSLDLYFKIMNDTDSADIKAIFSSIIEEEKVHLKHLGNLFEEKI
jgi:rubrerythrin